MLIVRSAVRSAGCGAMKRGAVNPAERFPGHQSQQQRLRRNPVRELAESSDVAQSHRPLLQFEVAQIFQDDVRHGHAQSGGKILLCHVLLFGGIRQKTDQTIREIFGLARLVKFNRHSLAVRHLAKIFQIGANNWDSVGASQMRDSATPCGR